MEYELLDTGVFNDNRYFDVFVEYAKAGSGDILIKISLCNRGPEDDDGSGDVFMHLSNLPEGSDPKVGDRIEFEVVFDRQGRPRARSVRFVGAETTSNDEA